MKTKRLVTSAMMIAIATAIALVCDYIPFLNLPFGGTITIASMLPIILVPYMYGTGWGLFTGFVYSVIQIVMSLTHGATGTVMALFLPDSDSFLGYFAAVVIILLDYLCAYTVLGLGGIFRNKIKNKTVSLILGGLVAMVACYVCHIVSGAIFYGAWAEWFFSDTIIGNLAISKAILEHISGSALSILYSIVYNGCYMIPEMIITSVLAVPVSRIPEVRKITESARQA